MSDQLDPKVRKKLEALCRKITVAHELDPEIQEELYGHMEDKFLTYLSGEEPVTSGDALVLVKRHFGNPVILKKLLKTVHMGYIQWNDIRDIAAIWISSCVMISAIRIAMLIIALTDALLLRNISEGLAYDLAAAVISAEALGCLCRYAKRWRNAILNGHRPWFYRWNFLGLALISMLSTLLLLFPIATNSPSGIEITPNHLWIRTLVFALALCTVWIWWANISPRRLRALYALFGWLALTLLTVHVPQPLLMFYRHFGTDSYYLHYEPQTLFDYHATVLSSLSIAFAKHTLLFAVLGTTTILTFRAAAILKRRLQFGEEKCGYSISNHNRFP